MFHCTDEIFILLLRNACYSLFVLINRLLLSRKRRRKRRTVKVKMAEKTSMKTLNFKTRYVPLT